MNSANRILKYHGVLVAVAALSIAALTTAQAQTPAPVYDHPPAPSAPREGATPTLVDQKLMNGLRVIIAQRRSVPLVTVQLLIRSGGAVDPADRAGLANLTAELLTKGTRTRSAPQLAEAAEALGGSLEASAGWDSSSVEMTVTTPKVQAALALIQDVVRNPVFASEEIDRLRRQTLDNLSVSYSRPGDIARLTAARAVMGDGAYGHPLAGTPASLSRVQRSDIVALHGTYYRPDNAVLIFSGDIDAVTAMRYAAELFGSWKQPRSLIPAGPAPMGTSIAAPVVVVDMPGAGQAGVNLVMPGIASNAPDADAGLVANDVLGGGYSSRLNQEIRIKRGLSYGAGSGLSTRRDGGVMAAAAQTKNPSAPEVVALLGQQLDALMTTPVGADELAARKASLIGGVSRGRETTEGLAAQVAYLAVQGLPLSDLAQRIARIGAVSADDVRRFANAHWTASARRVVVAGDATQFMDALSKASPQVLKIPRAQLDLDHATLVLPQ